MTFFDALKLFSSVLFIVSSILLYLAKQKYKRNVPKFSGTLNIIAQKNEEPFLALDIKDSSFIFNKHIKEVTFVINRKDIN